MKKRRRVHLEIPFTERGSSSELQSEREWGNQQLADSSADFKLSMYLCPLGLYMSV